MTAVLYDEVVAATSAPRLRVVPDPTPTALPTPKTSKRSNPQLTGADPLVDGAAPSLSDRDAVAPTFEEVRASGLLPTWAEAQRFADDLRAARNQ